jgi:hypothetical protein
MVINEKEIQFFILMSFFECSKYQKLKDICKLTEGLIYHLNRTTKTSDGKK